MDTHNKSVGREYGQRRIEMCPVDLMTAPPLGEGY